MPLSQEEKDTLSAAVNDGTITYLDVITSTIEEFDGHKMRKNMYALGLLNKKAINDAIATIMYRYGDKFVGGTACRIENNIVYADNTMNTVRTYAGLQSRLIYPLFTDAQATYKIPFVFTNVKKPVNDRCSLSSEPVKVSDALYTSATATRPFYRKTYSIDTSRYSNFIQNEVVIPDCTIPPHSTFTVDFRAAADSDLTNQLFDSGSARLKFTAAVFGSTDGGTTYELLGGGMSPYNFYDAERGSSMSACAVNSVHKQIRCYNTTDNNMTLKLRFSGNYNYADASRYGAVSQISIHAGILP